MFLDWLCDINNFFDIDNRLIEKLYKAEVKSKEYLETVDVISSFNHFKVLKAFQKEGVTEYHFQDSTGYGYGDLGRDTLDRIYAKLFGGKAGLVRPQIVSGTHALTLALSALLRPGDILLSACGRPYDTLTTVIGLKPLVPGNLGEWGIKYAEVELDEYEQPNLKELFGAVSSLKPRMCLIQRSRGYSLRPSLGIEDLSKIIDTIKKANKDTICLVDNCYGEFVERQEPGEVGADLSVGSLIKNPGGGLAPGGGYIVGREELVERVAARLTAPGLGAELGAFNDKRLYYQGLYLAPLVVREALYGAIVAATFFKDLGYAVNPLPDTPRKDIVQCIVLGSSEALVAFCQGLQKGSPIESMTRPEPASLPGYKDPVIMAGGTFIQGSSIELSADAPLREPYVVYLQGGQAYLYSKVAFLMAAQEMMNKGLFKITGDKD